MLEGGGRGDDDGKGDDDGRGGGGGATAEVASATDFDAKAESVVIDAAKKVARGSGVENDVKGVAGSLQVGESEPNEKECEEVASG